MCKTAHDSSALMLSSGLKTPQVAVRNYSFSPIISNTRDSSDFEFDFSKDITNDEPPVSPKLNAFSPIWEKAASNYNVVYDEHIDVLQQAELVEAHQYDSDGIKQFIDSSDAAADFNANEHEKRRPNLGSLMMRERRELEQFPPLQHQENRKDVHATQIVSIMCSSPSTSSSAAASSSSSSSSSSTSSSAASPLLFEQPKKSSRKSWPFKADILMKKALVISPNAADEHHRPQLNGSDSICSNDHVQYHANHADITSSSHIERFADVGSLQYDHYHHIIYGEADINYAKFESPRRYRSEREVIRGANLHTNAGGPARPVPTSVKRPMSPHAQHYQQQRARAEEQRRRTFLPYRHSLLGACFSPQGP